MRVIFSLHFMQSAEGKENQNEIHLKSSHLPPQAVQYTAEHIIMPCVFSPNRLFIGGASLEDRGGAKSAPPKKLSLHCIKITVYGDDGYSGTNFNRPGFQKMLSDMEDGKIAVCIIKDLSRLGRNHTDIW